LNTVEFCGTVAAKPVLDALTFLKSIEGTNKPNMDKAPKAVVQKGWRRIVIAEEGAVDRQAYTFCVLDNLRDCLRSRDLFVAPSARWADPRAKLLQGDAWRRAQNLAAEDSSVLLRVVHQNGGLVVLVRAP
jgi:hypothetical protein